MAESVKVAVVTQPVKQPVKKQAKLADLEAALQQNK